MALKIRDVYHDEIIPLAQRNLSLYGSEAPGGSSTHKSRLSHMSSQREGTAAAGESSQQKSSGLEESKASLDKMKAEDIKTVTAIIEKYNHIHPDPMPEEDSEEEQTTSQVPIPEAETTLPQ
mmetsp:Transcript_13716/g.21491  ORF Transcript_13716/g.21491 Transcript_13716/m.21491 type:complete len:122 (-) Transcript_13716:1420-1785(-)